MKLQNEKNLIDVSLIIDDSRKAKFTVDVNEIDNDYISSLNEQISQKLELDDNVKKKLFFQLKKKLLKIQEDNCKNIEEEKQLDELFNKLYYKDTQLRLKKKKENENSHREKEKEELDKYTFTPEINIKSNIFCKKNNKKNVCKRLYKGGGYYQMLKIFVEAKKNQTHSRNETNSIMEEKTAPNKIILNNKPILTINSLNDDSEQKETPTDKNKGENKEPESQRFRERSGTVSSYLKKYEQMHKQKELKSFKDFTDGSILTGDNFKSRKDLTMTNNYNNISEMLDDKLRGSIKSMKKKNPYLHFNQGISNNEDIESDFIPSPKNQKPSSHGLPIVESEYENNKKEKINFNPIPETRESQKFTQSYKKTTVSKSYIPKERINKQQNNLSEYSFRPKISKRTNEIMSKRKETKKKFFERLNLSKKLNETKRSMEIFTKNTKEHSKLMKKENKCDRICVTEHRETNESTGRKTRRYRNTIREDKNERELQGLITEIKTQIKDTNNYYAESNKNYLEQYKTETFKKIFELVTKNYPEINFNILDEHEVPFHIKEKIVKPAFKMIEKHQLDINFQNFYLIACELSDKFFKSNIR